MNEQEGRENKLELQPVFDGTNQQVEATASCDDECVGGTANTSAMFATN